MGKPDQQTRWTLRHGRVDFLTTPSVMGVLNVTPDSFSDGGRYINPDDAIRRADEMIEQGADIIDVGAESTRPGSDPVSDDDQIRRIEPVIPHMRRSHPTIPISIDTRSARVAAEAIEFGADIINDVSALRDDSAMADLAARTQTPVILMHMRGRPKTMQSDPEKPVYEDVVGEIVDFLAQRVAFAEAAGIPRTGIAVDPGIGFGKTTSDNLRILRRLDAIVALGLPVVLGASRKRLVGEVLGREDPSARRAGSLACAAAAVLAGAWIIRAHDVRETVDVVRVAAAIRNAT